MPESRLLLKTRHYRHADAVLVIFLLAVCAGLWFAPSGFEERLPRGIYLARGRILSVDNSAVQRAALIKYGHQTLQVELLGGNEKGLTANAYNQLTGKLEIDQFYVKGDTILVEYSLKDGKVWSAVARGHYRLGVETLLLVLFALLVIGFGGWTGLKALVSFLFSALMIWKVMVPCFLKGYDPIYIGLGVVLALTGAICFLVGGINRKGAATFLGSAMGLGMTCILAGVFIDLFRIHGAVRPFAELLLYSGFPHLDLTKIFLAAIFTACSGAVMDLSMDISAAMHEVILSKPGISLRAHIASGMSVGRAVIGTMTTTLLLAYSGSYITMLMVFMGRGVPMGNMFNLNVVSAEVLNTVVGSFGLVTVAPFTALVAGLLYRGYKPEGPATAE